MTDLTIASCYLGLGLFILTILRKWPFLNQQACFSSYYVIRHKKSKPLSVVNTCEHVNLTGCQTPRTTAVVLTCLTAHTICQWGASKGSHCWYPSVELPSFTSSWGLVKFCFHIKISLFTYLCSLGAELWENGKFFWGVPQFFWASSAVRQNTLFLLQPVSSA